MDLHGGEEEKLSEASLSAVSFLQACTEGDMSSSFAFSLPDEATYTQSQVLLFGLNECLGDGEGGEEEEVRMLKLRRNMDQLDSLYSNTEDTMICVREKLRVCAGRVAELQGQREALEELIDTHQTEEEDSASVFAMRAQFKALCEELHREEELHSQLSMELRQHELQLCKLGVQMASLYEEQRKQRHPLSRKSKVKQDVGVEENSTAQTSVSEAKKTKHKTPNYIRDTMRRVRQVKSEREERSREEVKKRTEAILSLKNSIQQSQEALRVQRRRVCERKERREKKEQQQLEVLRAVGSNTTGHTHLQKHLAKMQRRQEEAEERQRLRRMEIVSKLLQEEELKEAETCLREKQRQPPPPPVQSIMRDRKRLENILHRLEPPVQEAQLPPTTPSQKEGPRVMSDSSSGESSEDDKTDTYSEEEEDSQSDESLLEPGASVAEDTESSQLERVTQSEHPRVVLHRTAVAAVGPQRKAKTHTHTTQHTRPPFSSKPHTLHFKDFEVGKVYKRRITLTNLTYSTNYCRLLGINSPISSYVTLSFQPPGPMSPGMSCEMDAVFTPVLNEDLEGEVCFSSAAGDFSVPVRCTTKKCQVNVDSNKVVFGSHVVGQRVCRSITLTNSGARSTRYFLLPASSSNYAQPNITSPVSSSSAKMCVSSREECGESESPVQQTSDSRTQQHTPDSQSGNSSAVLCMNECVEEAECVCVDSLAVEKEVCSSEAVSPARTHTHTHTHTHSHSSTHSSTHTHSRNTSADACSEIQLPEVREGMLSAFSSVTIQISFNPTIPGDTHLDFIISFSEPDCSPISMRVCATAVNAPVCVMEPDLDLKICTYGRLYQHTVTLHSRSSTALRVVFSVCKELRKHMEILPKTAYIQAHSTFQAHLKFLPRLSLPEDAGSLFHKDTGVLEAPLYVHVADQVQSLSVMVHAVVTRSDVVCVPSELDFGLCTVQESVTHTLKLTNMSLQPQDYGFIGLPKFLDVQPGDGFGTLLPHETLHLDVIFSPHTPGEYTHTLTLKTGINREFGVCVRGVGVKTVLELSHTLVEFRSTAVGDESTACLYVMNTHTSLDPYTHTHTLPRTGNNPPPPIGPRDFCFYHPNHKHLTITPSTGRLQPGERCLVQVCFRPSLPDDVIRAEAARILATKQQQQAAAQASTEMQTQQAKKEAVQEKKGRKAAASRSAGKKNSKATLSPKADSPPNTNSHTDAEELLGAAVESLLCSFKDTHERYIIPCYVSDSPDSVLYLELRCPVMRPPLVISNPPNTPNTLNFQQVLLDEKVVQKVTIQNISEDLLELTSSVLDLTGPFMLLNALRAIRPGHTHTLLIAFTPTQQRQYHEVLEVRCNRMSLRLLLCGEGVEPMVTCSHSGPIMDFGHLLENDTASQVIKLYNGSVLPAKFSALLPLPSDSPQPPRKSEDSREGTEHSSPTGERPAGVFGVCPEEGVIPPGGSADVTITFQPQQTHTYTQTLTVQLSNKQTVCAVDLKGAAQRHTMHLSGGDEDLTHTQPTDNKVMLVTLRSNGGPVSRSLELTCIRTSQPVTKKNVEFMWEGAAVLKGHGISVEPPSTVDPGARKTLNITYTPKGCSEEMVALTTSLILKGNETEVYNVTLQAFPLLTHTS